MDLYIVFLGRKPHEVECQSLCGSEVTPQKVNSWKLSASFPIVP